MKAALRVLLARTALAAKEHPHAERDLMIPARDGSWMATDIYRPPKNGVPVNERFLVLLNRTPYDKTSLKA